MENWDWVLTVGIIIFIGWIIFNIFQQLFPENRWHWQYLIVIVHNKENAIEGIVRKAILYQRQMGDRVQLLIVDLNSSDKTLEIIKRMGYPHQYFSLITLKNSRELSEFLAGYASDGCLVIDYTKRIQIQ